MLRSLLPACTYKVRTELDRCRAWPPRLPVSSVAQPWPTLCYPVDCSAPGLPVHHQLPEFTQTHVHSVGEAIQPPHPLSWPVWKGCNWKTLRYSDISRIEVCLLRLVWRWTSIDGFVLFTRRFSYLDPRQQLPFSPFSQLMGKGKRPEKHRPSLGQFSPGEWQNTSFQFTFRRPHLLQRRLKNVFSISVALFVAKT